MPARNILVINCGSSSIKFALVNEAQEQFPLSGLAERLGSADAVLHWQRNGQKDSLAIPGADHRDALAHLLPMVQTAAGGHLHGIGHRVVHGGESFTSARRLDEQVIATIAAIAPLAPLHNPAALQGIEAALKLFPTLPQVAVFDTAFHQSMPEHAYRYAPITSATAARSSPACPTTPAAGWWRTWATAARPAPSSTAKAATPAWA